MTMTASETYERFDILVMPFPFSDQIANKKRPVVVLSSNDFLRKSGHLIVAMITTAKHSSWPHDTRISDLKSAGLEVPCLIRLKLFTADRSLIIRKLGRLNSSDSKLLSGNLSHILR